MSVRPTEQQHAKMIKSLCVDMKPWCSSRKDETQFPRSITLRVSPCFSVRARAPRTHAPHAHTALPRSSHSFSAPSRARSAPTKAHEGLHTNCPSQICSVPCRPDAPAGPRPVGVGRPGGGWPSVPWSRKKLVTRRCMYGACAYCAKSRSSREISGGEVHTNELVKDLRVSRAKETTSCHRLHFTLIKEATGF